MRIGVFGRGRLGSAIAAAAAGAGVTVAWQTGRDGGPAGRDDAVDAAIDASAAPAVAAHLAWAIETGTDLVIGVTGFEVPDLRARVGSRIGAVVAPNFSLTVALLARLSLVLARHAAAAADRDLYLLEHHHARKADAPSGTAKLLASVLLKGCPRKTSWALARPGEPLPADALSVGVLRAGHTYSSHVVGLDAPGEVVEISHAARSAAPYAEGALAAARWVRGRKGLHTMEDVAGALLDPLFREVRP